MMGSHGGYGANSTTLKRTYGARSALSFLVVVSALSACDDGESGSDSPSANGDFYVEATLGDERLRYAGEITASIFDESRQNHLLVIALRDEPTPGSAGFPSVSFEVNLPDAQRIAATTYEQRDTEMIFRYSLSGTEIYHSQATETDDFRIEITEISAASIKGRFEGTLADANDPSRTLSVLEGDFVAPLEVP